MIEGSRETYKRNAVSERALRYALKHELGNFRQIHIESRVSKLRGTRLRQNCRVSNLTVLRKGESHWAENSVSDCNLHDSIHVYLSSWDLMFLLEVRMFWMRRSRSLHRAFLRSNCTTSWFFQIFSTTFCVLKSWSFSQRGSKRSFRQPMKACVTILFFLLPK